MNEGIPTPEAQSPKERLREIMGEDGLASVGEALIGDIAARIAETSVESS